MERARILVVEDDFLIRITLAEALADDGFDVLEAGDAAQAMAHFQTIPTGGIILMLTDIRLPGGTDGNQLGAQIRAAYPTLPIIYMTGHPSADPARSQHDYYINKPYLPSEVCATVRRITQNSQAPAAQSQTPHSHTAG
jgi:DNA-binding response OmpR family regulator